jgi:ubiquinone/menaquinone biosynthesis C-methylase UbiE
MNRLPGGTDASMAAIDRLVGGATPAVRVLDAGTGAGDMPRAFAKRGWAVVAVDLNPAVLAVARRGCAGVSLVDVVEADVRALPFADGSFDVAHASLLVHHLDPDEVVGALRELRRVARRGVVVNDLRRGLFPLVATAASVVAFGRSRVTRTDGIVSARRSYTLPELDDLLRTAGMEVRWRSGRWLPRVATAAVPR